MKKYAFEKLLRNAGGLLLALFITMSAVDMSAQAKPMKVPAEYEKLPKGNVFPDCGSRPKGGSSWVVYSDKSGNKSYTDATMGQEKDKLNFLQPFYVAEEKGDLLHIIEWNGDGTDPKGKLKKELKDYGWCRKQDLILWPSSLVNNKNVTVKALSVIRDPDVVLNPGNYIREGQFVKFFNHPGLSKDSENQASMDMFEFLYVFKEYAGSMLVAKGSQITGYNADKFILGWVSEKFMQKWEDRLCLEPNWESEAATERKDKRIKAALMIDENSAYKYSSDPKFIEAEPNKVVWDDDPFENGWSVHQKRLPILNTLDNGLIQTGYITSVRNEKGEEVLSLDQDAEARKHASDLMEATRNINVLFVLDGSASVRDFYRNVEDAIQKMVNDKNNNIDVPNKLRFGAVVYRSEGDKNCPDGDLSVRSAKLSADHNDIIQFLQKEAAVAGCNNNGGPQNFRKGLFTALKMLDEKKLEGQTNYIVVVGGAGDAAKPADAAITDDVLGKMLGNTRSNILSFQYSNGMAEEFSAFPIQLKSVINKGAEQTVEIMRAAKAKDALPDGEIPNCKWKPLEEGDKESVFMLDYPVTARIGKVTFPGYGANMGSDIFSNSFGSLLTDIYKEVEEIVQGLDFSINGATQKRDVKGGLPPKVLLTLTAKMKDVDPEVISKAYAVGNYQFFLECFTTARPEGIPLNFDVFNRVLFYTYNEYDNLVGLLNKLVIQSGDDTERRANLKEVFVKTLSDYYGETEAKTMAANMSPSTVIEMITGVKAKASILTIPINDITDKKKLTSDNLDKMVSSIEKKLKLLKEIRSDEKYMFKNQGSTCYWIPEFYLP